METRSCSTGKLDEAVKELEQRKKALEKEIDQRRQQIEAVGAKTQTEYMAFVSALEATREEGDKAMEVINGCILVLRELRKNPALDLSRFNITGCSQQRGQKCI